MLEGDRGANDVLCERFASLRGAGREVDLCVDAEAAVGPLEHASAQPLVQELALQEERDDSFAEAGAHFLRAEPKENLPVGVVLTIPAAGSESSTSTVITNEEGWYKRDAGADCPRPRFAIMDPVLTMTLPTYQTACGAADIMAHVMERYFTRVKAVDLTDRMCEAVLRTIIRNVPIALTRPDDYDVRAEIMWAGTIAHNDLLSTGRIGDWATHMIEHEVSGIYDVAHGAGLVVLFPAWMTHVMRHDVDRFAQFASRVFDAEHDYASPECTAWEGVRRLRAFWKGIGLPSTLAATGVGADRLDEMACKATERGPLGNFVRLTAAGVRAILELAR